MRLHIDAAPPTSQILGKSVDFSFVWVLHILQLPRLGGQGRHCSLEFTCKKCVAKLNRAADALKTKSKVVKYSLPHC